MHKRLYAGRRDLVCPLKLGIFDQALGLSWIGFILKPSTGPSNNAIQDYPFVVVVLARA